MCLLILREKEREKGALRILLLTQEATSCHGEGRDEHDLPIISANYLMSWVVMDHVKERKDRESPGELQGPQNVNLPK